MAKTKPASNTAIKPNKRPNIASENLPKKSLEEALKIATAIKDNYGNAATWEQIASALKFSPKTPNNKYLLWSATAYGIVDKDEKGNYRVTETGRKILSPTYDGEDREGIVKAIATPATLARFYSDYSSSNLPAQDIFRNVLTERYGIPKNRVDETINLIVSNAHFAKLIEEQPDGKLKLRSVNAAVGVGTEPEQKTASSAAPETMDSLSGDHSSTEYEKACFIITPIGDDNSAERKHADAMLRHLITPVLEQFKITPIEPWMNTIGFMIATARRQTQCKW